MKLTKYGLTKYGPKEGLSPTLGDPCGLCGAPLVVGDYTTLVARSAGSRYANDGAEVHWHCAVSAESHAESA